MPDADHANRHGRPRRVVKKLETAENSREEKSGSREEQCRDSLQAETSYGR